MFFREIQANTPGQPTARRNLVVIANRVVELETRHIADATLVAIGRVSEPLPTRPSPQSPIDVTETGHTEEEAITALRHRIEAMQLNRKH